MNAVKPVSHARRKLATPSSDMIALLLTGQCDQPQRLLGPHELDDQQDDRFVVRAFLPQAEKAWVVDVNETVELPMKSMADGLFEARCSKEKIHATGGKYKIKYVQGESTMTVHDPYAFEPLMTELDLHLFNEPRRARARARRNRPRPTGR